jgi:hypothetical protein
MEIKREQKNENIGKQREVLGNSTPSTNSVPPIPPYSQRISPFA